MGPWALWGQQGQSSWSLPGRCGVERGRTPHRHTTLPDGAAAGGVLLPWGRPGSQLPDSPSLPPQARSWQATPVLQDLPPNWSDLGTFLIPHPLWLPAVLGKQLGSSVRAGGRASSQLPLLLFSPSAVPTSCSRRAWGSVIPSVPLLLLVSSYAFHKTQLSRRSTREVYPFLLLILTSLLCSPGSFLLLCKHPEARTPAAGPLCLLVPCLGAGLTHRLGAGLKGTSRQPLLRRPGPSRSSMGTSVYPEGTRRICSETPRVRARARFYPRALTQRPVHSHCPSSTPQAPGAPSQHAGLLERWAGSPLPPPGWAASDPPVCPGGAGQGGHRCPGRTSS